MTTQNNGGPAFPCFKPVYHVDENGVTSIEGAGLSLLDWFAGMALQGYLSQGYLIDDAVPFAYLAAKAMIKARELSQFNEECEMIIRARQNQD